MVVILGQSLVVLISLLMQETKVHLFVYIKINVITYLTNSSEILETILYLPKILTIFLHSEDAIQVKALPYHTLVF